MNALEALLADPDALFVSCNPEAGPVRRYGAASNEQISAVRDPENPKRFKFDPDAIVFIPGSEFRRYSTEYQRAVRDGSLVKRTRADWEARVKSEEEAEGRRQEAFKKAAEKAAPPATEALPEEPSTPVVDTTPTTKKRNK